MARYLTLSCDACGKKQTEKTPVLACHGKREDGMKFTVDLCMACWKKIENDYGVHEEETKIRREFEVVNYEDIPRIDP